MMRVESQQVAIRHLKTTDADPLFENYLGDEQACRFLNRQAHQNVNQTLEAIERWRAQYDQKSPNLLVFAIEELTSQTPIGCLVYLSKTAVKSILVFLLAIGEKAMQPKPANLALSTCKAWV